MIITKSKPKEEILNFIKNHNRIFIVGCGSCAEQCKTGGEKEVTSMDNWLKGEGKEVTGWTVPDETCHIPLVKKELRKHSKKINDADAVLVMACGAGTSAIREAVNPAPARKSGASKRVYTVNDTISLGNTLRQGNFIGRCSMCGECILGETNGLCPVTLCPKGMLNGPCGGMDEGKCEVNKDIDCIWVKIYETKDSESLNKITPPKDYSKAKRDSMIEV